MSTLIFDVERFRETFNAIYEAVTEIQTHMQKVLDETVAGIDEKQYILSDRLDVITGQTTEDTET